MRRSCLESCKRMMRGNLYILRATQCSHCGPQLAPQTPMPNGNRPCVRRSLLQGRARMGWSPDPPSGPPSAAPRSLGWPIAIAVPASPGRVPGPVRGPLQMGIARMGSAWLIPMQEEVLCDLFPRTRCPTLPSPSLSSSSSSTCQVSTVMQLTDDCLAPCLGQGGLP